jgi:hypothetical protein
MGYYFLIGCQDCDGCFPVYDFVENFLFRPRVLYMFNLTNWSV